jgi:hypothetical protein
MKALEEVDLTQLKKAVKDLNDSGLLTVKVKLVAVSKETLLAGFTSAMENILNKNPDKVDSIPDSSAEMWNELFADEATEEGTEEVEEGAEEVEEEKTEEVEEKPVATKPAPKEKKEKPPKEPKPPKEKKEKKEVQKSRYGHLIGTQAAALDDMFFEGVAVADAAAKLNTTPLRVRNHIQHLKDKRGLKFTVTEGVYKVEEGKAE